VKTFFAEACATDAILASSQVVSPFTILTIPAVLEVFALPTFFCINTFVTGSAFENVVTIDAVRIPIKISSIHAILVPNCISDQIAVFALVGVVGVLAVYVF